MEKMPNLFVVGSAKTGTTSIYELLSKHPDIFVPKLKELNFMAFENDGPNLEGPGDKEHGAAFSITKIDKYLDQYSGWEKQTWALDCSPAYLYFKSAPYRIKKYSSEAKIIIVLRNPVECAFSMYAMMKRDRREPEKSFYKAFKKSTERLHQGWEWAWDYAGYFLFYEQVKRYLECFDKNALLILRYEYLRDVPDEFVKTLFSFLGISDCDGSLNSIHTNTAPTRRQMMNETQILPKILKMASKVWTCGDFMQVNRAIDKFYRGPAFKITDKEKKKITRYYIDDITKLEGLLSWDLSSWKRI
jgi:hypothetical protein